MANLLPRTPGRTLRALAAVALAAASTAALAAPRTKIAVTEIKSVQGVPPGTATILSDIVVSEVSQAGNEVVSQSDINAMIGFEKQKKVLGCSEETSCLAEIGGALGVDYMLAGQVGQIGSRYRISLLLVETRKARVAARAAQFCDQNEDALAKAAEATVRDLLAAAAAGAASAGAKAPALEATPQAAAPSLEAKPPQAAPLGVAAQAPRATVKRSKLPAYLTMGGGAAIFAFGGLVGLGAKKSYDDLEKKKGQLGYYDAYQSERSSIRSKAIGADVLMGTGIVVTGVGGWLWWRASRAPVAMVPAVGDGSVGLVASGSF